jgi:hypothetical protein
VSPVRSGPVQARRLTAQILTGEPARHPAAGAERLLAIQAQDPRGARLAVRARTRGLTAADIDRELTERRTLLISWLNRSTLHLVRSQDYQWLHPLLTPPLHRGNARRLSQLGIDPDAARRGVRVIERALSEHGPLMRFQLRDHLQRADVPTHDQRLVHLLFRATLEGVCVRGPMIGRQHAYALVRDWLGPAPQFDRDRALAELARRYLAGHGPALESDLARWAGLPLRDARAGLAAIASQLEQEPGGLIDLARREPVARLPPPRLLGTFEPVLLGWRSRADTLGSHEPRIVSGGMFRAFAMAGGRAVATWGLADGRITIEPLEPLSSSRRAALERDATAVRAFLG